VLLAKPLVGDEPFAVLLADDFMDAAPGQKNVMAQMTELYEREGKSLLAVQDVPRPETRQYGIVSAPHLASVPAAQRHRRKAVPEEAPSTLAVVGRYVLTPAIFERLENIGTGAGGEIQLTDAISALLEQEQILAYRYEGQRFDCGSKLGYLKAAVAMGFKHKEVGTGFAQFLQEFTSQNDLAQAAQPRARRPSPLKTAAGNQSAGTAVSSDKLPAVANSIM
jgi:UTP--glucose-1-phosphate uridylyltransferase